MGNFRHVVGGPVRRVRKGEQNPQRVVRRPLLKKKKKKVHQGRTQMTRRRSESIHERTSLTKVSGSSGRKPLDENNECYHKGSHVRYFYNQKVVRLVTFLGTSLGLLYTGRKSLSIPCNHIFLGFSKTSFFRKHIGS